MDDIRIVRTRTPAQEEWSRKQPPRGFRVPLGRFGFTLPEEDVDAINALAAEEVTSAAALLRRGVKMVLADAAARRNGGPHGSA